MKIGARILEAVAAVEGLGVATVSQVRGVMTGTNASNGDTYCQRAVGLGLMTVDRDVSPKRFRVVPGWNERVAQIAIERSQSNKGFRSSHDWSLLRAWNSHHQGVV